MQSLDTFKIRGGGDFGDEDVSQSTSPRHSKFADIFGNISQLETCYCNRFPQKDLAKLYPTLHIFSRINIIYLSSHHKNCSERKISKVSIVNCLDIAKQSEISLLERQTRACNTSQVVQFVTIWCHFPLSPESL